MRFVTAAALATFASALAACVADPPAAVTPDAGTPDAAPAVTCLATPPALFPSVPGAGPFCKGAPPASHCALGQHCCKNLATNAQTCAAGCAPTEADVGCFSDAECTTGQRCCVRATVDASACVGYSVLTGFLRSACESSCAPDELPACAPGDACGAGKACTPTYVLDATNRQATALQIGVCR